MDKILAITGATGKKSGGTFADCIASNIKEVKQNYTGGIRILARAESDVRALRIKIPDVEITRGDFNDANFFRESLYGVDTLVNVAGIHFSKKLIDAAAQMDVRRVILIHTTGIYSKYKKAGEEYRYIDDYVYKICKTKNIILTILRPTMIYGNLTDNNVCVFIKMLDKLPVMPVVNGARYQLQPVHYADLGKAYYQVLIHEKETANRDYILSGGAPIYLRDMFIEIGKNLGKNVHFISVPFPIAYMGAVILWLLTCNKIDYREKVKRLCEQRIFSFEEANTDFGYAPIDFNVGVVDEVKAYKYKKEKNKHAL